MKRELILALGMAALMLTATGCKSGRRSAAVEEKDNRVAVRAVEAASEVVPHNVEFTANIEAWQSNNIIPALQGARISRILVDVGDRVKAGQLVAEMDQTQYNTVRVQYETAKADYERVKRVYEAGGLSAQQLQQAETQYLILKESVDNIARHVRLYSPINGVVTARAGEVGDLFTAAPILEIMQIDRLKVKVNISEQFFPNVRVGTPVTISVDIFPDETFEGSVSLIYPAIDVATRTFTVEVAIPNQAGKLRPGMFARCDINMGESEAVLVPDVAVQKQTGTNERYVYVIENGTAHRRTVVPGRQVGDRIVVGSGVEAGDAVAITSFSRLADGAEVRIVE